MYSFSASIDLYLPNLVKNSSAQYLVSTRTKYTGREEATPVLGFGLLQDPCILISLLHTGVVINISIVDFYYIPKIETTAPAISPSKKVRKSILPHVQLIFLNYTYFQRYLLHKFRWSKKLLIPTSENC